MSLCHAAATLALVSWYLMVPPHVGDNGHPDTGVPLVQWEQMGNYNSADECNADRESFMKRDQKEYNLSLKSNPSQSTLLKDEAHKVALKSSAALCIGADDPRLKVK
jgi:hypothetical protein